MEKRIILILRGEIIAIFKSDEEKISNYVCENYSDLNLKYEDLSEIEIKTIYVEI